MTPTWITLQAGPEPDERAAPAAARPGRSSPLFVTAALVLSLIVVVMLIAFVFEPLANAVGGCGGG